MTPELAFQKAIADLLIADPDVNALVNGQVFDEVPNDGEATPPYIYLGPMNRRRVQMDCGQVWTITARLYAISVEFGRGQAWETIEAIVQALDMKEAPDVTLTAPFSIQQPIQITQGGDVVDPLAPKSVFVDLSTIIARDN
ncbi:DUF3168 domain-containing protein [Methylobacterium sp. E-045]|uniref:DUF3168 domain-containing protein n=1 Tax=Methylobacterium sp. E-045 TaxID=2836575 RepID=UPI001FB9C927|nr:DUF3168 domain-containing protein [Methylobacterium sp. E-045]MCJ2132452.1 DUF3168 domain-containing protein [Methylobacterium sp. E-045]